ncbi:penicillin-binding protein 2 [Fictibacillus nanhaiensis]|uniref:penicillin-binding transpeptidase domain-containing protein n=1 Tax=Fictibacillus nanhaiensis TaxID=742169 RepID=UPI001C975946|nr:penicillin-binding transpeptidase domain-containing protein [Fictibacillus nanhaiensis]MBY6035484.1 penicillin-binding protein 2 [Fictibacillus nanhaiensis]
MKPKSNKKKNHVPIRINALFLSVFLLFSILVLRLGYVQIVKGEEYKRNAYLTENVTTKLDAPRGKMFDAQYRVVVDNEPVFSITYTRTREADTEKRHDIAKKLSELITKETEDLTDRDKKDYFIFLNEKVMKERITASEEKKTPPNELYDLMLKKVTQEDIESLTESQLEVLAIKSEMDRGYTLSPQRIKIGATQKEIAMISEHLPELEGIDIKPDAERSYPFKESFRDVFGQVKQIPKARMDYYTIRGNDRNDMVGTSFLEEQYESVLRGTKTKIKYVTDKKGNPVGDPVEEEGARGSDLVLTVDMNLQQKVESVIEEKLKEAIRGKYAYDNKQLDSAYVVMMDPYTGEILSMAAKEYDRSSGKFKDIPFGNIYHSYAMGSTVKGATVLTGLQEGVVSSQTIINDAPLTFGDGRKLKSHENMGAVDAVEALERSSNIYMWHIAMRLSGYDYANKRFNDHKVNEAFEILRNSYSQFGLGVPTGIDLPSEATGYNTGVSNELSQAMFFSIGQFDTYTPMQMAQYVATIANGGLRMQPHLLKEVREPSIDPNKLGKLLYRFEPNVLNKIEMNQNDIKVVQKGFHEVMNGKNGTAAWIFKDKEYNPAGKTGTAEVDKKTGLYNKTLIGYAPYDNPEVAFAVIVPDIREGYTNNEIGEGILDAYFSMKKEGISTKQETEQKQKEKEPR